MSIFDRTTNYKGFRINGYATSAKNRYLWTVRLLGDFDSLAEAKKAINKEIAKTSGQ